ncbi:MAG: AAA family ATPase [Candidatus Thiodiazotropha sp.]|nr:AAA family ATPase [Candidatus Thiodiazotropha sp.]MCM8922205.1 AAA family ATPase [Candidatus Thiodiazotropha sp.]
MKIKFIEIQNFRRLRSTHIDFDDETTIFVGANNSGKTSAMVALRFFLLDTKKLTFRDITLSNWPKLDQLGTVWEKAKEDYEPALEELVSLMPMMDLWFDVADDELHHVVDLIPTLEWKGGVLGLRLRYEPKELARFYQEFVSARKAANEMAMVASKGSDEEKALKLWPKSMLHFIGRRFSELFKVRAYVLNPEKLELPNDGEAKPQVLTELQAALDSDPLVNLIRIDEISAQRELSDAGGIDPRGKSDYPESPEPRRIKRKLSEQLRSYYNRHLSPDKAPDASDLGALSAIQKAETTFDEKLEAGFKDAIDELQSLGYPGLADPRLKIKTQLQATDGLRHRSAVQYELAASSGAEQTPLMLPEDYSGLGYQNLISMVFMLMSFRDDWMRVGKAAVSLEPEDILEKTPPLHLVLVEEPEAHLHAQVQQVFIKKAYALLRKNKHLGDNKALSTQLVVSTHSSHLAHEADFKCLRYFRRRPANVPVETPVTTVANLSDAFGEDDGTQRFVSRYLKATHCDLFFADAAILVEGQAERILVPHFIRYLLNCTQI